MGNTLTRALATVNERQREREAGKTTPTDTRESTLDTTVPPSRKEEGLRGVCRALFHHCVGSIGSVEPDETDEERRSAVSREVPGVRWFRVVHQFTHFRSNRDLCRPHIPRRMDAALASAHGH